MCFVQPLVRRARAGERGPKPAAVLASDANEFFLEILVKPSTSELQDWDFEFGKGEDAGHYFDKDMLEEIGERIQEEVDRYVVSMN